MIILHWRDTRAKVSRSFKTAAEAVYEMGVIEEASANVPIGWHYETESERQTVLALRGGKPFGQAILAEPSIVLEGTWARPIS